MMFLRRQAGILRVSNREDEVAMNTRQALAAEAVNLPAPVAFGNLSGDGSPAVNELTAAMYQQLHRIASRHIRGERPGHTLQATALVHEAYLKLHERCTRQFNTEIHFLAVASRVMRQVLVDHARARRAQKRAGGAIPLWTNFEVESGDGLCLVDVIELNDAIEALGAEDKSLEQLIVMRYFGGMTAEETAVALGISVHVIRHDLRFAEAWLRRRLCH
jgi:RNA polymerase sigma-70 factor, ECF subfamily